MKLQEKLNRQHQRRSRMAVKVRHKFNTPYKRTEKSISDYDTFMKHERRYKRQS